MNEARNVIVTFALPDESRLLTTALTGRKSLHRGKPPALPTHTGSLDGKPVAVAQTGVGNTSAGRERLRAALAMGPPRLVISAGYAGGLALSIKAGDLILGENFSDPGLAASACSILRDEPLHVGELVSRNVAAETAAAKSALAAATGALAVDMETAWIAELCSQAGVPLLSLRVISDAASQDFPVPGRILFDAARQRPRYVALPLWLLAHPGRIAPFTTFVRGLGPARARLTRALRLVIGQL